MRKQCDSFPPINLRAKDAPSLGGRQSGFDRITRIFARKVFWPTVLLKKQKLNQVLLHFSKLHFNKLCVLNVDLKQVNLRKVVSLPHPAHPLSPSPADRLVKARLEKHTQPLEKRESRANALIHGGDPMTRPPPCGLTFLQRTHLNNKIKGE